jgi:hypothetical protein
MSSEAPLKAPKAPKKKSKPLMDVIEDIAIGA